MKELYTKNDILNQLNSFEIPKEKIVLIHTSLRSVGSIEGGPKALTFMVGAFFSLTAIRAYLFSHKSLCKATEPLRRNR